MTITLLAPDGVAVTAQQERQAKAAQHGGGSGRQLGLRSGFRVGTSSNILTATSTTWTLGPCALMLDPGASTYQGGYGWSSDSNVTGSMTAADATYARKDIVYIQVNDSSAGDGSGATSAPVLYLAGTASSSPVAPTLPARSFLIGTISVPVAGGGSPTVARNPAVYVAAGAPLPVSSQAERDALSLYDGISVRRMDLPGRPLETYDGAQWWTSGFQALTPNSANFVNAPAGYGPLVLGVSGKIATLTGNVTWVNGSGGNALATIPAPYLPAYEVAFSSTSQNNGTGGIGTSYRGVVTTGGSVNLNWLGAGLPRDSANIIPVMATWVIA